MLTTSADRRPSLLAKLGCSSAVLLGLLVTIEVGLRGCGYDPFGRMFADAPAASREGIDSGLMRIVDGGDEDILVYELNPGARGYAWQADIQVNSSGFRDREFPPEKSPGTLRILALGDSATFGAKLPVEVLWPAELERLLFKSGLEVEVFNLGVVGYDVLEEVALLEKYGPALDPDLILVAYHPNDIGHVSATRTYIHRLQGYGSAWYRIRLLQYLRSKADLFELNREFHLVNTDEYFLEKNARFIADIGGDRELSLLMDEVRKEVAGREELKRLQHRYLEWYTKPDRIGKLRYSFERLQRFAGSRGIEVFLFVVPWLGDRGHEAVYDGLYAVVRHEAERNGFEFVPTAPTTRALGHEKLLIEKRDFGHPNATGHRLMAERLQETLLAR